MLTLLAAALAADPEVTYDRGERGVHGDDRTYVDATACDRHEPCVVTRYGALKIDPGGLTVARAFNVGVGVPVLEEDLQPLPFLGVHIGGLVELVQRVGTDPGRRCQRFFEAEREATSPD